MHRSLAASPVRSGDALHDYERSATVDRLENWARLMRLHPHRAISMTGVACAELKRRKWKQNAEPQSFDEERFDKPPPVDHRDGWLVERVWVQLPDRAKWLLKALYILRLHPDRACRALKIAHRHFEADRRAAENLVRNRLQLADFAKVA